MGTSTSLAFCVAIASASNCFAADTTEKIPVGPGETVTYLVTFKDGTQGGLKGLKDNQQGDRDPANGSIEILIPGEASPGNPATAKSVVVRDANNVIRSMTFENGLSSLVFPLNLPNIPLVSSNAPNTFLLTSVDLATLNSSVSFQTGANVNISSGNIVGLAGVVFYLANSLLTGLAPGEDPIISEATISGLPLFTGPAVVSSQITVAAVPEPEALLMMVAGLGAIGLSRWARTTARPQTARA